MLAVHVKARIDPILAPDSKSEARPARRRRGRRSTVARALALAAVAVLPAVFYVSQRAHAARTGYAILQLRQEVGTLQSENARLQAVTMSLKSLERVERIATKDLGMRRPGAGQLSAIATTPVSLARQSPVEAPSFWARLGAWLGWSEAEAHESAR